MAYSPKETKKSQQRGKRFIYLASVAILIGVGFAILLAVLLRGTSETAAPVSLDTPTPTSTVESRQASPQPTRAEKSQDVSFAEVALVNEQVVDIEAARITLTADQAMAQLLGQPFPTGTELMERLINGELVMQAASDTDFTMPDDDLYGMLDALLAERNLTQRALNDALAVQGISLSEFKTYFARLAFIDAFSRAQAAEQGISVPAYIDQLQNAARISYGPATAILIAEAGESRAMVENQDSVVADISATTAATATVEPSPTPPVSNSEADSALPDEGVSPGQLAPGFTLPVINHPASDSLSRPDLLGQPTVLSFWTTWCPYCRRQTPVLVDAYQQYADQGIRFVGIDVKENQEVVETYLTQHGIAYPIALDHDGQVASSYEVRGFPTTYFLDAEGKIIAQQVGALSAEKLENFIQRLLTDSQESGK